MANKIKSIFEWNIIAISYTTLRIITVSFIIFILALSVGIYYYFTRIPQETKTARELMQSINLQVNNIKKIDDKYYNQKDLGSAEDYYNNAKTSYEQENFSVSIAYSKKALEILDRINEEIEIKREPHRNLNAIINHVQGTVNIRKSGELEWVKAEQNVRLAKGDTIRTLSNSQAFITFEDGSKMQLHPNSYMEIGDLWEDRKTRNKQSKVLLNEPKSKVDFVTESNNVNLTIQTPGVDTRIVEKRSSGMVDYKSEEEVDVKLYEGQASVKSINKDFILDRNKSIEINIKEDKANILDIPPPVSLVNPMDKKVISISKDRRITAQWVDLSHIQKYIVEVSTNPYFTEKISTQVANSNQIAFTNVEEGNYYWRVIAVDRKGVLGAPSATFFFKVIGEIDQRSQLRPSLTLDQPLIFGPFVIITGKTDKGSIIFANNERFDVRDDGTFQATVKVEMSGQHSITVVSRNPKNDMETSEQITVQIIV